MATSNTIYTTKLVLPREIRNDLMGKVKNQSVIAALVPREPQSFVDIEHIQFDNVSGGEWVGEGENKSSMPADWKYLKPSIHKAQITRRFSDEFRWADEDSRTEILTTLIADMGEKMAEMVDAGIIHAAEPKSRTVIASMKPEALAWTANQVATTDDIVSDLDSIADTFIEDYDVTGIAFDRMYANEMRKVRNENTGAQMYPDVPMGLQITNFNGLDAVMSGNVSGKRFLPVGSPSGIKAIAGNWNMLKWGYVREFGLQEIPYGDPDGEGDLQRKNEVAYRLEAVIAWLIADPTAFAVLRDSSTIPSKPSGGESGGTTGGDDDDSTTTTQSAKSSK